MPDTVIVDIGVWRRILAALNTTPFAPQDRREFKLSGRTEPEGVAAWLEGHKDALIAFGQKYQGEKDELEAYRDAVNGLAWLLASVNVVWDGDAGKQLKGAEGTAALKGGLAFLFAEMQRTAEKRGWRGVVPKPD